MLLISVIAITIFVILYWLGITKILMTGLFTAIILFFAFNIDLDSGNVELKSKQEFQAEVSKVGVHISSMYVGMQKLYNKETVLDNEE